MSITNSISAIGNVCAQLQRPYGSIQRAIVELRIKPALVINAVPHYADSDVERIAEHLTNHKSATDAPPAAEN